MSKAFILIVASITLFGCASPSADRHAYSPAAHDTGLRSSYGVDDPFPGPTLSEQERAEFDRIRAEHRERWVAEHRSERDREYEFTDFDDFLIERERMIDRALADPPGDWAREYDR